MSAPTSGGSSNVRLGLIRDFELRLDGEVVDVAPATQRLVAFLALQGDRPVRRAHVSGVLWPDAAECRAGANLRSAIWRAPACWGVPLVGASNTHVWLHPDVDVDLRRATAHAREVLDRPSLTSATIDLSDNLAVFGADLLLGWFDEWAVLERERFRQLRLHVLEQLGELLLGADRIPEALQVGLVAVATEPLRESAHRLLVRAHLREGNPAEALGQYRRYADLLAEELHVRPSAVMEELVASAMKSGVNSAVHRATEPAPVAGSVAAGLGRPRLIVKRTADD